MAEGAVTAFGGMNRGITNGGHFARYPEQAHAIAAIRCQVQGQHTIIERQHLHNVCACDGGIRKFQQPGRIVAESQFLARTQHAGGFNASQPGRLDLESTRQLRPNARQRCFQTRADILRATDDLQFLLAIEDAAYMQLFRVRVLFHTAHFPDHDAGNGWCSGCYPFDFHTGHRQGVRERRHVIADVDPFTEPGSTDLHL